MKEHLCGQIEYVCSMCGAEFNDPWEECPECSVKMKKIKYDPVSVEEYDVLSILLEDDEDNIRCGI